MSGEVLSVLSVPSPGISEKFPARGSLVLGIRRPPDRQNLNAENSGKHLPHELSKLSKPPFGINSQPEPDEVEIEERVPEPYLDGWARLQCQKPMRVADAEWPLAIDDAGRFLDQRGSLAMELGWAAGELFDVPRDGRQGGSCEKCTN
jgi:hypothetical protein